MEDYLTDRERVEWLRARVKEHAPWALAGVVIALAGLFGWRQYQAWHEHKGAEASQKYSEVLDALSRADRDRAVRLSGELHSGYTRTPYADLADFALARYDAEGNKLDDAERRLDGLVKGARDEELRVVARLRLARVQRAEGKLDAALATLAGAPAGVAGPAFAEVRGDILADKGDRAGALAAWHEALESKTLVPLDHSLIELKVGSLESAAAPTPASTPAATGAKP